MGNTQVKVAPEEQDKINKKYKEDFEVCVKILEQQLSYSVDMGLVFRNTIHPFSEKENEYTMGNQPAKQKTINERYLEDIKWEAVYIQQYCSGPKTFDASELQKRVYANRLTNHLQTVHRHLSDFAQAISKNMTREHIVVCHRGIKGQRPAPVSIRMLADSDYVRPLPSSKSYNELYLDALERRMVDTTNGQQSTQTDSRRARQDK